MCENNNVIKKPEKDCNLALYIPKFNKEISLKLFDEIVPGDIIYAPTTRDEEVLGKLEESHRIRPHFVACKTQGVLYAYAGTSDKKFIMKNFIYLDLTKYGSKKGGNVNFDFIKAVKDVEIIGKFGHLKIKDICTINKQIYEINEECSEPRWRPMIPVTTDCLEIGMIILRKGKLHCIYDISDKKIFLRELKESKKNCVFVNKNKMYEIDFETHSEFNISKVSNYIVQTQNLKTLNFVELNKEETGFVSYRKGKEKNKKNINYIMPTGQIITAESKKGTKREFIYLYTQNEKDYAVEILPNERISRVKSMTSILKCGNPRRGKILEQEELLDILRKVSRNEAKYGWLYFHAAEILRTSRAV